LFLKNFQFFPSLRFAAFLWGFQKRREKKSFVEANNQSSKEQKTMKKRENQIFSVFLMAEIAG
jgi:hypothetical protein